MTGWMCVNLLERLSEDTFVLFFNMSLGALQTQTRRAPISLVRVLENPEPAFCICFLGISILFNPKTSCS